MNVLVATPIGMCSGVRRALTICTHIPNPTEVTILGELVHNRAVAGTLRSRGFHCQSEEHADRIPCTPTAMVTAHGISDARRRELARSGVELIDTTCPLVRTGATRRRLTFRRRGSSWSSSENEPTLRLWVLSAICRHLPWLSRPRKFKPGHIRGIGVICQTTADESQSLQIVDTIKRSNPQAEVRFINTICGATRDRQQAVRALLSDIQALVVVGSANSNNTRQLELVAAGRGLPTFRVECAEELPVGQLRRFACVGLTAGASTPDTDIRAVWRALVRIGSSPAHDDQSRVFKNNGRPTCKNLTTQTVGTRHLRTHSEELLRVRRSPGVHIARVG